MDKLELRAQGQAAEQPPTTNHLPTRSPAMTDEIPIGSYLIRNVGTGRVLSHTLGNIVEHDNVGFGIRDEGNPQCREYQTWWIEPIPEQHEFFEKEIPTLYTITQLASGKSLDASIMQPGGLVYSRKSHGAPWQLWRFDKVENDGQWLVHIYLPALITIYIPCKISMLLFLRIIRRAE
jgi:hypothetical protein